MEESGSNGMVTNVNCYKCRDVKIAKTMIHAMTKMVRGIVNKLYSCLLHGLRLPRTGHAQAVSNQADDCVIGR